MKKIISLTLTLLLVMGALFVFPASAANKIITSGDWKYKVLDDGTVSIREYLGTKTKIAIPDEIDGHTVTKLAAFQNSFKNTVEKVTIGAKIKKITPIALSPSRTLKTITVSSKNKTYASKNGMVFNKALSKLIVCPGSIDSTSLTLPKTVTAIGAGAFEYNRTLRKISIPNTVRRIGETAFAASKIRNVSIPSSVKVIGGLAFSGIKSLKKVSINKKAKLSLEPQTFSGCSALTEVTLPIIKKTEKYGGELIFSECTSLISVNIPSTVKYIPAYSFYRCPKLKSVIVPSNVTKIGAKAFAVNSGNYTDKRDTSFIIKGKKGTAAEAYAKRLGCKFKAI